MRFYDGDSTLTIVARILSPGTKSHILSKFPAGNLQTPWYHMHEKNEQGCADKIPCSVQPSRLLKHHYSFRLNFSTNQFRALKSMLRTRPPILAQGRRISSCHTKRSSFPQASDCTVSTPQTSKMNVSTLVSKRKKKHGGPQALVCRRLEISGQRGNSPPTTITMVHLQGTEAKPDSLSWKQRERNRWAKGKFRLGFLGAKQKSSVSMRLSHMQETKRMSSRSA